MNGYINLQACDPTVQLCNSTNSTFIPSNSTDATGILTSIGSLVGIAANSSLPLVGAFQLTSGIVTLFGEVIPNGFSAEPYNYELYLSITNTVFGTLGLTYGMMKSFFPAPFVVVSQHEDLINLSSLVTGGVTLGLYIKASTYASAFTPAEQILNLLSSCLALAFGFIHLFAYL